MHRPDDDGAIDSITAAEVHPWLVFHDGGQTAGLRGINMRDNIDMLQYPASSICDLSQISSTPDTEL